MGNPTSIAPGAPDYDSEIWFAADDRESMIALHSQYGAVVGAEGQDYDPSRMAQDDDGNSHGVFNTRDASWNLSLTNATASRDDPQKYTVKFTVMESDREAVRQRLIDDGYIDENTAWEDIPVAVIEHAFEHNDLVINADGELKPNPGSQQDGSDPATASQPAASQPAASQPAASQPAASEPEVQPAAQPDGTWHVSSSDPNTATLAGSDQQIPVQTIQGGSGAPVRGFMHEGKLYILAADGKTFTEAVQTSSVDSPRPVFNVPNVGWVTTDPFDSNTLLVATPSNVEGSSSQVAVFKNSEGKPVAVARALSGQPAVVESIPAENVRALGDGTVVFFPTHASRQGTNSAMIVNPDGTVDYPEVQSVSVGSGSFVNGFMHNGQLYIEDGGGYVDAIRISPEGATPPIFSIPTGQLISTDPANQSILVGGTVVNIKPGHDAVVFRDSTGRITSAGYAVPGRVPPTVQVLGSSATVVNGDTLIFGRFHPVTSGTNFNQQAVAIGPGNTVTYGTSNGRSGGIGSRPSAAHYAFYEQPGAEGKPVFLTNEERTRTISDPVSYYAQRYGDD